MAQRDNEANETDPHRRSVLAMATGAVVGAAASAVSQQASAAVTPSEIVMMDGVTLGNAIHARQASCVEVMTAYLDHIERLNPKVNAIVALQDREGLLAQARERDGQLARGRA
jgi:amidase